MRIGMLTKAECVGRLANEKRKKYRWVCDCGGEIVAATNYVRFHNFTCCGCKRIDKKIKHAKRKSRVYRIWTGIKNRCLNKNSKDFEKYSNRGICEEWMDFVNFYNDMGDPPSDNHQIDRIDNNGIYSKENCRWATATENSRNKSCNYFWFIFGKKYDSIQDVADEYGVTTTSAWKWFSAHKCRGRQVKPRDGYVKVRKYDQPV